MVTFTARTCCSDYIALHEGAVPVSSLQNAVIIITNSSYCSADYTNLLIEIFHVLLCIEYLFEK